MMKNFMELSKKFLKMAFVAACFVVGALAFRSHGEDTIGSVEFGYAQQMCVSFDGLRTVTTRDRKANAVVILARCANDTVVTREVTL